MTAQPTRDQLRVLALRKDAEAHQRDDHTPDLCGEPECVPTCVVDGVEWPCETAWLRDQLDAAERRVRELTQEVRDERGAARDQMEQVRIRDARIKRLENRAASATARANAWREKHRVMARKRDVAHRAWLEEFRARRALESVPPPGQ